MGVHVLEAPPLNYIVALCEYFWPLVLLLDGVGVGQWWTDRADSGQVHGSPEDCAARLVPQHGRWRDMAKQHLPQKSQEVRGSHSCPLG